MGKYFCVRYVYDVVPMSQQNFRKALKRIGQKDPWKIRKTRLHGKVPRLGAILSEKDYINRGVLNVRKELNRHLGESGKYTNRMISFCSKVTCIKADDGTIWLRAKLPLKEYKRIIEATYKLLNQCDSGLSKSLLQYEKEDKYFMQNFYKSRCYKTVAPIQTNMIIRTFGGKTDQITRFAANFRNYILEVK